MPGGGRGGAPPRGRGRALLEGGGRRARGGGNRPPSAQHPSRPGLLRRPRPPLPRLPRGFPRPSPLAQPRTWKAGTWVEGRARTQVWTCNRSRSLAAGRAAPWPRSPSPELSGLRVPLRVRSQEEMPGPGAGRRVRRADGSSSRFLERVGSAGCVAWEGGMGRVATGRAGVSRPLASGGPARPPSERRQVRAFSFFRAPRAHSG